jgi:tellurite methyltransferase
MARNQSIDFFDSQFQRQVRAADFALNPFEQATLPHVTGRVLDFGCGLGNFAVAAARQGCSVVALDASPTAIEHLQRVARETGLPITASEADLRVHEITADYDAVVSIGLLMFFDRPTAVRRLQDLRDHVRPGGVAAVNVLVEGTTFMDMFDPSGHCLFARGEVRSHFAGWQILHAEYQTFDAPNGQVKAFDTVVARRPR